MRMIYTYCPYSLSMNSESTLEGLLESLLLEAKKYHINFNKDKWFFGINDCFILYIKKWGKIEFVLFEIKICIFVGSLQIDMKIHSLGILKFMKIYFQWVEIWKLPNSLSVSHLIWSSIKSLKINQNFVLASAFRIISSISWRGSLVFLVSNFLAIVCDCK